MFLPTETRVPTATCDISLSGRAITAIETVAERHQQVLERLNTARRDAYHRREIPFDITVSDIDESPWLPPATVERINWENAYRWQNAYNEVLFNDAEWDDAAVDVSNRPRRREFRFYTISIKQDETTLHFPFETGTIAVETPSPVVLSNYDYASIQIENVTGDGPRPRLLLIREDPIERAYQMPAELDNGGFQTAIRKADSDSLLHAINAAINKHGMGGDKVVALARYLTETVDTVRLSIDSDARVTYAIADALAPHVTLIPQRGDIVMSRSPLPASFDRWEAAFPLKQELRTDETAQFYRLLYDNDVAEHMSTANDPYLRGRALPAIMQNEGTLTDDDVKHYALCPWQPWDRESVHKAVQVGVDVRTAIDNLNNRRGITFAESLIDRLNDDGIPIHWSLS